jgi:hypothetical protein
VNNAILYEGGAARLEREEKKKRKPGGRATREHREFDIVNFQMHNAAANAAGSSDSSSGGSSSGPTTNEGVLAAQDAAMLALWHAKPAWNPVTGKYVLDEKERVAEAERQARELRSREERLKRLPTAMKHAKAKAADALQWDMQPQQQQQPSATDSNDTRKKGRAYRGEFRLERETQIVAAGERERRVDEQRRIGRVSLRRWDDERQKGYDPITNEPFKGLEAKALPQPDRAHAVAGWSSRFVSPARPQPQQQQAQTPHSPQ